MRRAKPACWSLKQYNYKGVTLRRTPYDAKDDQRVLEDMFSEDPLGLQEVPKTNVKCCQSRTAVASDGAATSNAVTDTEPKASVSAATDTSKDADTTRKKDDASSGGHVRRPIRGQPLQTGQ